MVDIKNILKNERWIIFSIIPLLVIFIIRLVDSAKLLLYFPLDLHNDISAFMAMLHFMKVCGFHEFCPYWFNGFTAFQFTTPGWFFFALPLYSLLGDVKIAAYFSMVISFVASFLIINYFLKEEIDFKRRLLMFLLIFANAVSIGNFIRLGRPPILLGWTLFLFLFLYLIKYKNNPLNKKSWLIIPIISASLILIHYVFSIFVPVLFLGYFISKNWKERLKIIFMGIISIILSSFWLIPFIKNIENSTIPIFLQGQIMIKKFYEIGMLNNIMLIIVPLSLIILYILYTKEKKRKEKLFFAPIVLLAALFLSKLTAFIPILNTISHDHYIILFIMVLSYFLVLIDFKNLNKKTSTLLKISIMLAVIVSILITIFYTPWFIIPNDQANQELKELLPYINVTVVRTDFPIETSYGKAYDSYIPIYYNQSVAYGWYYEETTQEYSEKYLALIGNILERDCRKTLEYADLLNVTNYLGYGEGCPFMIKKCHQKSYLVSGNACLVFIS